LRRCAAAEDVMVWEGACRWMFASELRLLWRVVAGGRNEAGGDKRFLVRLSGSSVRDAAGICCNLVQVWYRRRGIDSDRSKRSPLSLSNRNRNQNARSEIPPRSPTQAVPPSSRAWHPWCRQIRFVQETLPRTAHRARRIRDVCFRNVCVHVSSMFKFDSLGGRRATRAPRPPERHAPGPRGSSPLPPSPPRARDGAGHPRTRSPGARRVIHLDGAGHPRTRSPGARRVILSSYVWPTTGVHVLLHHIQVFVRSEETRVFNGAWVYNSSK
jgi:hypothetical protein